MKQTYELHDSFPLFLKKNVANNFFLGLSATSKIRGIFRLLTDIVYLSFNRVPFYI